MENKLELLRSKIENETRQRFMEENQKWEDPETRNRSLEDTIKLHYLYVFIKPGKKYTKIDVGRSGKYMIDKEGNIFGIKAYGVIHKGHNYGTLDTIDNWYWGGYVARKIQ